MTKEDYLAKHPGASLTDSVFSNDVAKTVSNTWKDDSYKEQQSKAIREGQQASEKFHQMVQDNFVNQSTEQRKDNARKREESPAYQKKKSARVSDQMQEQWQDDEWKDTQSKKIQKAHLDKIEGDPEYLKKLQDAMAKKAKKAWADPKIRKRQRERISKQQTERMLAGTNNWVLGRANRNNYPYEFPNGKIIKMRSSYELALAYDLDERGVKWFWEPRSFPYTYKGATLNYIPDFYLPDYDIYIEVGAAFRKKRPKERAKLDSVPNLVLLTEVNYPFKDDVAVNDLDVILDSKGN